MSDKWHKRYLELARHISDWSKDPSSKIGAVAVGDYGQVLSQGFNGFPRGIADTHERLHNREEKYKHVIHAEMNVIYNASLTGISLAGSTLYVYGLPICSNCALGIIQAGINTVVIPKGETNENAHRWLQSWMQSKALFEEAGVRIIYIDL